MKININRKRFVVVRDDGQIFCGLSKNYQFKPIDEIGDTAIKTYMTAGKAKASFLSSWYDSKKEDFETGRYRVVEVTESVVENEKEE